MGKYGADYAQQCRERKEPLAEAVEVPAGMCPAPINGKRTVAECVAAGYCGCDERLPAASGPKP